MTLQEKIISIALSTTEEEFSQWVHKEIVALANFMQSLGINDPYEKAKTHVFKILKEVI